MANPKYQNRIRVTVNSPESKMLKDLAQSLDISVMALMAQLIREKHSQTFTQSSPLEAMENTHDSDQYNIKR